MSNLDGKIPGDRTMRLGRTQMPPETKNAAGDGEGRPPHHNPDGRGRPSLHKLLLQPSLSFFRRARAISGNFGRIAEYFNHTL
jgi:hypothetical protein